MKAKIQAWQERYLLPAIQSEIRGATVVIDGTTIPERRTRNEPVAVERRQKRYVRVHHGRRPR